MKKPILFLSCGGLGTSRVFLPRQAPIDYNSSPPNLSTLANASLFSTWRPKAHVLPANGQIGDPCMHYTSSTTNLFHVGYLHNGASGATTSDLVTYTDLNPDSAPFIMPGGKNDPVAVFDGSVIERGVNGTPTLLYTSVSYLPIQWTIRYTKGSETQSLAIERDGGKNFTKLAHGPVIPGPETGLNVTGFRDPFVFQSKELDGVLGNAGDGNVWYTLISGGVHGEGPSLFLYRNSGDEEDAFQTWEYLGEWWHEVMNSTWSENGWAGRWGYNFEVANIFSLDETGASDDTDEVFVTVGAEWSYAPIVPQVSDVREMLWVAGTQSIVDGQLTFEPTMAGRLDSGKSAYAAAGKVLPATSLASRASGAPDRAVTYLWLTGDFYGTLDFPKAQQNWTGSLLLPRELSVGHLDVVDNALAREKGAWRVEKERGNGTVMLATLRQRIARETLAAFKNGTTITTQAGGRKSDSASLDRSPRSRHYMLSASIQFPERSDAIKAGFRILSGSHESTTIYYQFSNESVIVDRSNSSAAASTTQGISTENESGKFRLFDIHDGNGTRIETMNITIVVDGGVLEVHVNERFALSTWVWSWFEDSRDVSFFVDGGEVEFGEVKIWEGLVDAWPQRKSA